MISSCLDQSTINAPNHLYAHLASLIPTLASVYTASIPPFSRVSDASLHSVPVLGVPQVRVKVWEARSLIRFDWFGHEGGQNTHFQMLHWGMANAVLLVAAAVATS